MRVIIIPALGAVCAAAYPAEPPWWRDEIAGTAIIDPSVVHDVSDNHAPANQGQLKNVAKNAALYLNTPPLPGAGAVVNNMVSAFSPNASDFAPINLGQLKAVAKPFYDRLIEVGFDTKQSLRAHGGTSAANWDFDYPWNPATPVSENYAPANIGQLKWVFSFESESLDSDGDTIPDVWEIVHFGGTGPAAGSDDDLDGTSNADELAAGTDPNKKDNPLVQLQVSITLR